jgi:hypothetical protein
MFLPPALINSALFIHPSVCLLGIRESTPIGETFMNLNIFWIYVQKIKVSVSYDSNNGHLAWSPMYILYHTSLSSSENEKCFKKLCTENQNTCFMFNNYFRNPCSLWENVKKIYGKSKQTTDNDIICWMNKARTRNMLKLMPFHGKSSFVHAL